MSKILPLCLTALLMFPAMLAAQVTPTLRPIQPVDMPPAKVAVSVQDVGVPRVVAVVVDLDLPKARTRLVKTDPHWMVTVDLSSALPRYRLATVLRHPPGVPRIGSCQIDISYGINRMSIAMVKQGPIPHLSPAEAEQCLTSLFETRLNSLGYRTIHLLVVD